MIGFGANASNRHPIYGERIAGRIGYVERDARGCEWYQNREGRRIARILRYKPHQAPQAQVGACGGTIIRPELW